MVRRPTGTVGRPGRTAAVVAAVVLLLIVVVALVAAPPLSRPLVGRLVEGWLRAHGAEASVEVTALSDTGLTARVRVGGGRDPDLTIDRLDVTYAVSAPWTGRGLELTPRAVRLFRPRLKARLRNDGLDLGQLTGLVDWARRLPPTGRPLPDITIVDGQARLATPGGMLTITGDGAYVDRRSLVFTGRLTPFHEILSGAAVEGEGGVFRLVRRGPRLLTEVALGATRLEHGPDATRMSDLLLQSDLPWPERSDQLAGPASLHLSIEGLSGVWGASRLSNGAVRAVLTGAVDASPARSHLIGGLTASIQASDCGAAGARISDLIARTVLQHLELVDEGGRLLARGRGAATLSLGRWANRYGVGSALTAAADVTDGSLAFGNRDWSGRLALLGRAVGRGRVAAPVVRQLVGGLPLVDGARPYAGALGAALKDVRFAAPRWRLDLDRDGVRLAFAAPARLDAASGARLVLSGGGQWSPKQGWRAAGSGALALSGGGLPTVSLQASNLVAGPTGLGATFRVRGVFDTAFAKGADAEANGRLVLGKEGSRLDLLECAPLKAERLAALAYVAQRVALRVCPAGGTLLENSRSGWRAHGRLEALQADDPDAAIALRNTDATFDVRGGKVRTGDVRLALGSATVVDLATPLRFRPLFVEGKLQQGGEDWHGAFTVSGRGKRQLARLSIAAPSRGAARVDIDTGELIFAPGALQPVDLTPLAAGVRDVEGRIAFRGWIERDAAGRDHSGGELVVRDLALTSPAGPVTEVESSITFTRLWPPITAPDQKVTVAKIASIVPLQNLAVVFDLRDGAVDLRDMRGDLAGGSVSLAPTTVDLRAGSSLDSALALHGIDLGEVLAATSLDDQIKLQAVVDGRVPFTIGPSGLSVREGALRSVGGGRLSISRTALGAPSVGSAVSSTPPAGAGAGGAAQDFAYQALENLAFEDLEARLNTLPNDRLGVIFQIKGRHDPPKRQRATVRLSDVMRGRAMEQPIALPSDTKIDLTLDTSLNFGELVRELAGAWRAAIGPARLEAEVPDSPKASR